MSADAGAASGTQKQLLKVYECRGGHYGGMFRGQLDLVGQDMMASNSISHALS